MFVAASHIACQYESLVPSAPLISLTCTGSRVKLYGPALSLVLRLPASHKTASSSGWGRCDVREDVKDDTASQEANQA